MKRDNRTDLVGILVGGIMRDCPPLVFYLYSDGPVKRHTRVRECKKCAAAEETVKMLTQTYHPAVVDVWSNRFYPCWYFVQLKKDFGPDRLRVFGLPWTVYQLWRTERRIV